jgi:HEAT repeat protein
VAEALGNIQAKPDIAVVALQKLIESGTPDVRRSAADALGNLVQIVTQQEKRVRTGDAGRLESRRDLLATGILVVPAGQSGLVSSQPVEVRRLSADALQQMSAALVDMTQDPVSADKYPPPGRPWTPAEAKSIEDERETVATEREQLQPLLDAFAKDANGLGTASTDPDPYVRIQTRHILEDVTTARTRLRRREASIPRGEAVPSPRPDPKPADKKDVTPKAGGAYLPPAVTPSGVPVWLVAQEKDKPAAARPNTEVPGAAIQSTLPAVVAGLSDPNVRARLAAVEVLETMSIDAVPAIPALVNSLGDRDRFVRWAAARTLGRLAPRSPELVVPAIARLVTDGDLDVEVAAATALERYGPAAVAAVPTLGLRASSGDSDIRIAAMKALEAIGTDAAPALPSVALNLIPKGRAERDQQREPDPGPLPPARARLAAADTLGRFGKLATPAIPVLQSALNDIDSDVRRAASEAILKITAK